MPKLASFTRDGNGDVVAPVLPTKLAVAASPQPRRSGPTPLRRLSANLPEPVFEELEELASKLNRNVTETVRMGLSLLAVWMDAKDQGLKVALVDSDGKPIKEILMAT